MGRSLPPKTLLRATVPEDAPDLAELVRGAGPGMGTMPQGEAEFAAVIEQSLAAQRPTFVLERMDTGRPVGLSSMIPTLPAAAHSITCEVRHDGDDTRLRPHGEFVGSTELCTLYLKPEMRGGGNGRLLSLGRFFDLLNRPGLYADRLIVELRGVLDEQGVSPLWASVCERVLKMESVEAHRTLRDDPAYLVSRLSEDGWLDISDVPAALRALLGQVHQNTEPARRLLAAEGFMETGYVDLLDAGPVLACATRDARLIKEAMTVTVARLVDTDAPRESLIATVGDEGPLRCCRGAIDDEGNLAEPAARALRVEAGMSVRYASLRPA
ncbi:MAG: arginine N-succinyltransferase [Planctomycetota bacterium]